MRCFVDGREVPCGTVAPPAMDYGQHWRREGCRRCRYRFVVSVGEFLARVAGPFDQFRREVSGDVAGHAGDWHEPEFGRFRELAFPPLPELLHGRPDLLADLLRWADLDLLNWLDGGNPSATPGVRYSANSVDRCLVGRDAVAV